MSAASGINFGLSIISSLKVHRSNVTQRRHICKSDENTLSILQVGHFRLCSEHEADFIATAPQEIRSSKSDIEEKPFTLSASVVKCAT